MHGKTQVRVTFNNIDYAPLMIITTTSLRTTLMHALFLSVVKSLVIRVRCAQSHCVFFLYERKGAS